MNHKGTITLETERLILRRFTYDDVVEAYNNWFSDPDIAMYMQWDAHTDIFQTEEFIKNMYVNGYEKNNHYRWAITLKTDNKAIGAIGFQVPKDYDSVADIAYLVGKKFWNKGIVTEALKAVLHYALIDVGINRVEAFHAVANPASGKVMQKAGMKFEGCARQKYRSHKGYEDSNTYAILQEDLSHNKAENGDSA